MLIIQHTAKSIANSVVALLVLLLFAGPLPAQDIGRWDEDDVIPGRLLVRFQAPRSASIKSTGESGIPGLTLVPIERSIKDLHEAENPNREFVSILPDVFIGEFNADQLSVVREQLSADPDVIYVEPDRLRTAAPDWATDEPNDPQYQNGTLWNMDRIGAPYAWGRQSAARANVRLAVMEPGRVNMAHQDLTGQSSGVNNHSGSVTNHATHVAGIAVATGDNGLNVVGVANVELSTLDNTNAVGSFAQQIVWACNNDVDVINMSWHWCGSGCNTTACGGVDCDFPAPSATEQDAITNALDHIIFVAAATNENCEVDCDGDAPTPASYDGVIAVSNLSQSDTLGGNSNSGYYVDLTAPGVSITSTITGNAIGTMSGTSMASPHVAGTAAAVLAVDPSFDNDSLVRLLELSAEDIGDAGWDDNFGYGVVRVDCAVFGIADVYAEVGASGTGTLIDPLGSFTAAESAVSTGGRIGLVSGTFNEGPLLLTQRYTVTSVGGSAVLK